MNIQRHTVRQQPMPQLKRRDSAEDVGEFEDLQASIEGEWGTQARRQLTQASPRRQSMTDMRPQDAAFGGLPRPMGYMPHAANPEMPPRSWSAVVAGVSKTHLDDTSPEMKAHRRGLDSHSPVIVSRVQASANALIAAYFHDVDVDKTLGRLSDYLAAHAGASPASALALLKAASAKSPIDDARNYLQAEGLFGLKDDANAHYYLAGNKGAGPGFHMRDMCAMAWHLAERWSHKTDPSRTARDRMILQSTVVQALADFTLDSAGPRERPEVPVPREHTHNAEFRCTFGQVLLLMRALQGWFDEVRVDFIDPPTPNEFMQMFCYNLRVLSRTSEPSEAMLLHKAIEATGQIGQLYHGYPKAAAMVADVAGQIADYYDMNWPGMNLSLLRRLSATYVKA